MIFNGPWITGCICRTVSVHYRDEFKKVVAEATGKTVVLEEKVNENLIGGYVLSIGDTQIDTSVRKKLNELKLQLA